MRNLEPPRVFLVKGRCRRTANVRMQRTFEVIHFMARANASKHSE